MKGSCGHVEGSGIGQDMATYMDDNGIEKLCASCAVLKTLAGCNHGHLRESDVVAYAETDASKICDECKQAFCRRCGQHGVPVSKKLRVVPPVSVSLSCKQVRRYGRADRQRLSSP